jgi:hypothetical protein
MNITYLDADSREVIDVIDDPAAAISEISAERFAARLRAAVARILPIPHENEWKVELKIPLEVRRLHTPLPGDRVRFMAKAGVLENEVLGVYQFKRQHSYVIFDDSGGEWEVQSIWHMKKCA